MNENLKYLFSNVNEWLKFAETKHIGLITFNSAIIIGIISVYKDYTVLNKFGVILSLSLLVISIIISILSQFPSLDNSEKDNDLPNNFNFLYFEHLKNLTTQKFKDLYTNNNPNETLCNLDNCLINQIIINSRIASFKYKLFKSSIIFTIISLIIIAILILIQILPKCQ